MWKQGHPKALRVEEQYSEKFVQGWEERFGSRKNIIPTDGNFCGEKEMQIRSCWLRCSGCTRAY